MALQRALNYLSPSKYGACILISYHRIPQFLTGKIPKSDKTHILWDMYLVENNLIFCVTAP